MSKSEVNPRVWWIVKSFYPEQKEVLYRHKPEWKDIELGNERVKVIDHHAYDSLKKENEELKARIGKLRKALQKYAHPETHSKDKDGFLWYGAYFDYETAIEALKEDGNG